MSHELDPQVKAFLEQFRARKVQSSAGTLTPADRVAAARQRMGLYAQLGIPVEEVAHVEDVAIPGTGEKIPVQIPLRLYVPRTRNAGSTELLPALVYYHGGGFVAGGLDSHDSLMRALANRGGCLVVSVGYRLPPEHPYPAAHEDAWSALTWAHARGAEIGVDADRLAVGGDSAGGLFAARVAQKAAKKGPPLRLQVLLYPNLDATMSSASWRTFGSGAYLVSHGEMIERFDAYLPPNVDRRDPVVSPLFATDLSGVAPAFIATSDHDPLRDEAEAYTVKLRAADIEVDYECWLGMIHGLASFAGVFDAGRILIDQIGMALRRAFSR